MSSSFAAPFPGPSSAPSNPIMSSSASSSHSRKTSFTGHKPLSLETKSVTSPVTPRRAKRMSLSYITSPTTCSVKAFQGPSSASVTTPNMPTSSSSGSYFSPNKDSIASSSASISQAVPVSAPLPAPSSKDSGADDWLMSDDDAAAAGSAPAQQVRSMAERDSAKIQAQFHDSGYREGITAGKLSTLQGGFDQGFNQATRKEDGETVMQTHKNLLTAIAERERRCLELREELRQEEKELKRLQTAWQTSVHKDMACDSYSTSPTAHRRSMSSSLSNLQGHHDSNESSSSRVRIEAAVPQVAAETWNNLSSKIPGSFKSQLSNFLDQMAVTITDPAPELPEKDLLKPTSLSVLEEEGSDAGSTSPTPRSPRSPSVALLPVTARITSISASSSITGATFDSALPETPSSSCASSIIGYNGHTDRQATPKASERGPPTSPKTETIKGSRWQSKRNSMLSSLSMFQKQVFQSSSPTPSSEGKQSLDGNTGWGNWAKRLKDAREGASDLLKEAERKLGNAMTMDELLGLPPNSGSRDDLDSLSVSSSHVTRNDHRNSQLWQKMQSLSEEERERLAKLGTTIRTEDSPWFAAARGTVKKIPSPLLSPQLERKSSTSSTSSQRRRSISPSLEGAASPPALGVMGSGIYELLSQAFTEPEQGEWEWDTEAGWGNGNAEAPAGTEASGIRLSLIDVDETEKGL